MRSTVVKRAISAVLVAVACCGLVAPTVSAEVSGGRGGRGSDAIGVWVIGDGPGGGVADPGSGVVCTAWSVVGPTVTGEPDVIEASRHDERGVLWLLHFRICGGVAQYVWVPEVSAADLSALAFDEVLARLPRPTPLLSPDPVVGGWVNFETWLALDDPGVVTATAQVLGLSATATARVVWVEWSPGDGSPMVVCAPLGALPPSGGHVGAAPCGHTFGSASQGFDGQVTLVWSASWAGSDGSSGDLGEARSSVGLVYRVREIQTIGVEG